MNLDFQIIKRELADHFYKLANDNARLFEVEVDKDELWNTYLDAIPAEANPIFRTRREYDCSCCRHFIKSVGNVVAIKDNQLISIWDFESSDPSWGHVAKTMAGYVKSNPVVEVFLTQYPSLGTNYNNMLLDDGKIITWDHFFVKVPENCLHTSRYDTIDTIRGQFRDIRNVFKRSLDELSLDAVDTVMDLINQGSLYRGDEYKAMVQEFRQHKKAYMKLSPEEQELYTWEKSVSMSQATAKIRNTAIGTLLIDISANEDLDTAVSKYEAVTAPANYKRSKPIFSKKMLEDAKKTITDLGYLDSLERRYANADDITVNNIIFSNRDTAKRIQGSSNALFDALEKDTKGTPKKFDRVEEITIEKFIKDVVPNANEIEAYVEGKHIANFMSLIAPVHPDSKIMFKWNNNFSWAYTGNVTDSMLKQNVKNAGGKVDGVLRFSIQWNDLGEYDGNDLDAHCIEPNRHEIFFSTDKAPHRSSMGGQLDVDIINPLHSQPAVENITWPELSRMKDGVYKFFVHCYSGRGGRSGFRAEIEFNGEIYAFDYQSPLRHSDKIEVAEVTLKNGVFSIKEKLPSNCSSREIWGIKTNEFTPVSVICYSPNYWDEQNGIGNKHYFFMLKDCVNPELPNSFYNEFLNNELYPAHRKVLEALASKAHVQETDDQLSGLGFSSTLRNELVVKVKGATDRVLKIKF